MTLLKWSQLVAVTAVVSCGCRAETARDTLEDSGVAPNGAISKAPSGELSVAVSMDPIYTVAAYDPTRDASEDLKATVVRATSEGKRIILEIGGQW